MEIVLATGNRGKAREFQTILHALLAECAIEFSNLSDYPSLVMPPEGGDYEANARAKALTVAHGLGKFALADDSGIEVAALGWRPGPYSARYAGNAADCAKAAADPDTKKFSDAECVALLLAELQPVPAPDRVAHYVCLAAFATPSGKVFVSRGECAGVLLEAPRGQGGFGYDPVFWVPEEGKTMAELPESRKHRISHRGRALAALRDTILRELGAG